MNEKHYIMKEAERFKFVPYEAQDSFSPGQDFSHKKESFGSTEKLRSPVCSIKDLIIHESKEPNRDLLFSPRVKICEHLLATGLNSVRRGMERRETNIVRLWNH